MPTAAKLVAGLAFAAIGYVFFVTLVVGYGENTVPAFLLPLCCGAGLVVGWVICGTNARDLKSGIGNGYTAIVAQGVVILFVVSFMTMLDRSLRRRYDGPMEAMIDNFYLMFENAIAFATPEIGMIILVGGFVGGAVTGITARRFPR